MTTLSEFVYFPDDENWATWMTRVIAMTNFGGADFGEIHRAVKGLKTGDYEGWHNRWRGMAEYVEGLARLAEQSNHDITARKSYLRAYTYYRMSQLWLPTMSARALQMFDKMQECYSKWAELSMPKVERVSIPFEGIEMLGWLIPSKTAKGKKSPIMIYCGPESQDCGVLTFTGPLEASERGVATLLVDGPGQGTTLRYKKIYGRPDFEKVFSAMVDYLEARSDIDAKRLAVFGSDMGAYCAARAAALDKRVRALGNITACYDVYTDIYLYGKENHREGLEAYLGTSDPEEVRKKLSDYNLKGIADKITCPLFVMHAEETAVYPVEPAYRLYREARGPKEIHIVNAGHTIMDRRMEAISQAMDWVSDQLTQAE
jgi:dipeptidyl aminopeptidase/acylaminoacyl peptidase